VKVSGKLTKEYANYEVAVFAIAWSPESRQALLNANMEEVGGFQVSLTKNTGAAVRLYQWNEIHVAGSPALSTSSKENLLAPENTKPLISTLPSRPSDSKTPPPTPGPADTPAAGPADTPSKRPKFKKVWKNGGMIQYVLNRFGKYIHPKTGEPLRERR
jgi:hypothetical protein